MLWFKNKFRRKLWVYRNMKRQFRFKFLSATFIANYFT